jgi:hypothetical protein
VSRRVRVALCGAGATLAVAATGWLALVAPARSHASRLATQIDDAQSQVVALEAAQARSPKAAARDLYRLERAMPTQDDLPGILLELDRLARASGVSLQHLQPSARVTLADGSSALPLTVAVEGRYPAITAFLRRVRLEVSAGTDRVVAAGRLFDTDQVTLVGAQGDAKITATLQLVAFDYAAPPSGSWTPGVSPARAPAGAEAAGGR